jgi:hypothetical protein
VADDLSALHGEADALKLGDVRHRITGHGHETGEPAGAPGLRLEPASLLSNYPL